MLPPPAITKGKVLMGICCVNIGYTIFQSCFSILFAVCQSVRLLPESVIPPHALKGHQAVLRCDYDMEGDDLYSVKWYFNQKEFYRFIPSDNPKVTIFNHHKGVKVNVSTLLVLVW